MPSSAQQPPLTRAAAPEESNDGCLRDTACAELYQSARNLSRAGQYEAALVAYQSAYARRQDPWLLVNIGRMQQKIDRPQQAVVTYRRLLADPAAQQDLETQQRAQEYLRQAEQESDEQRQRLLQPAVAAAAPSAEPPASGKQPVRKKWWFWTLLGGATAAAAAGIGATLGSRLSADSGVPPNVGIYEPRF